MTMTETRPFLRLSGGGRNINVCLQRSGRGKGSYDKSLQKTYEIRLYS